MALVSHPWVNHRWLAQPANASITAAITSILLDAAADRITMVGRFVHKDHSAKTVDGAGFLLGTVTKAAGSTLQLSLQDVDLATGPPLREDGTPDQTMTIANADAGFASNLWYEGGFNGAATRSLTPGDLIAVVLQFGTFVSADTVNIRFLAQGPDPARATQGSLVTNLSGSYVVQSHMPNVALRCSDGTYGTIEDSLVFSAINTHTFASNTGVADEYALAFQFPYPCALDGFWASTTQPTATDTTELILYEGTTALRTVTVDHNAIGSTVLRTNAQPCAELALTANTLYRIAIRPLGTNTISVYSLDVANANHLQCHPGGTIAHLWTRLDQGAWGGEVTTRRLFAGVRLSGFDNGVSAGGGIIAQSTIAGGS